MGGLLRVEGGAAALAVARGIGDAAEDFGALGGRGIDADAPGLAADDGPSPLEVTGCFLAASRARKVARRLSVTSRTAVAALVAELVAPFAAYARAAGRCAASGAGRSGGAIRVWLVGFGEPVATQPEGRVVAPEKSSSGCRGSASCRANVPGDGAILGAALNADSPESDGAWDVRVF